MPRAGKPPLTPGFHKQTLTFAGVVLAQLPMLSEERQQHFIEKPHLLAKRLRDALVDKEVKVELTPELVRWQSVYKKLFCKTPELGGIRIPTRPQGFGPMRLIVVVQEIVEWTDNRPLQGTMDALKAYFPCWQNVRNLDVIVTQNDRDPRNGPYALWVRDVCEADEENAGKSANDLASQGHVGITLLERMLLEMDYWMENGENMDFTNRTLCGGSRNHNGGVPLVAWRDHEFCVAVASPSNNDYCSRSVWC